MIRVDLQLPIETTAKSPLAKRGAGIRDAIQDPAVIGVFLIAVLTLIFALALEHRADVRHEALNASVQSAVRDSARFEEDLRTADQLRAKRNRIEQRIAAIAQIDQNRFAFVHVLDQLAAALVADIWLAEVTTTSTDASGGIRFGLSGYAPDNETAQRYMSQLEHSPFIAGVALQGTTLTSMNGQDVVRFVISAATEVPDQSFILTETIRPDGTRISDLDGASSIVVEPSDSLIASPADSLVADRVNSPARTTADSIAPVEPSRTDSLTPMPPPGNNP